MPYLKPERPEKVSAPSLRASKQRGERLVCLTAYDYPTARIVDEAGIDIILVGDSLGNVVLGYGNTVPVTLEEILIHLKAVRRAVQRALLVADMPYGTFHTGDDDAVRNALQLVKEGGAEAIKLEGGHKRVQLVKRLVDEEISVMGHIGLTPQSINQLGAYRVQGKTPKAAQQLIDDAKHPDAKIGPYTPASEFSAATETLTALLRTWLSDPVKLSEAQAHFFGQFANLWNNIFTRAIGLKVPPLIEPGPIQA